jgi:hypothetical protein
MRMAVYVEPQKKYTLAKARTMEAVVACLDFTGPVWGAEFGMALIPS